MSSVKVVAVLASPHRSGSTATAVSRMMTGVRAAGGDGEVVDLAEAGADAAVAAIEAADAVILGSPVYRASHTSLLSQLLEQLQRGAAGDTSAPLLGTAVAIVLTGASGHHYLATENLRATMASFFAAQTLSPALYLTHDDFTESKELTDAAGDLAEQHGRALVELAAAVAASTDLRALRPLI